jgi:hypothetical protein
VTVKQRLKNTIKITVSGAKMSEESKEKALPGYKSLADTQKEQNLQTQNIISQNEIIILLLDRLCTLKEVQFQNDSAQYEKWQKEKVRGARVSFIQVAVGIVAVWLGIIEFNGDNPIVSGFGQMLARLTGGLL